MMFDGAFGAAGAEVVIEEFSRAARSASLRCATARPRSPLASAQDHKRVFDHDEGPNTGGMGAYSPTPFVTPEMHDQIMSRIILPTVAGMKKRGTPFRGVLYAGVMLTERGSKAVRVQRPLRRSGMPGADAADDVRHRAGVSGVLRRRN